MTTNANTIQLSGDFVLEEALAEAAITPGHLVERISTGKVQKHSTEGGHAELMFAVEDALQGRNIDTAYAADELVTHHIQKSGAKVQAWLKPGGTAVVVGTELISDGAGQMLNVADAASGTVVEDVIGLAEEALDLSASGAVATRLDIRIK